MTLRRFQQIKRYLHVAPVIGQNIYEPATPEEEELQYNINPNQFNEMWWRKLEPLASVFYNACQCYYLPSSDIAIDELII
jgi:hypothetical protein